MKVLQIAVGVTASDVYYKLFSEFYKRELKFSVYVPLHGGKDTKGLNDKELPYPLYSNRVLRSYDKLLYFTKIRRMLKDIELNYDLSEISLTHAHSLFSDGAVAYELYKKHKIPYIVAVRNYDVNKYFKYAKHLKRYAMQIISNAQKVIFISPSYQNQVIDKFIPNNLKHKVQMNSKVIPNGVDEFWLKNESSSKSIQNETINLIFVGRIDKNKNLETVIKTTILLQERGIKSVLSIVGDGPLKKSLQEKYSRNSAIIFNGKIRDKEKLREKLILSDILVVPSFNETFGLVYLEAMSCGVPVIYTKNQGFDGQFLEGNVGFHVKPREEEDIANKVMLIRNNYESISKRCLDLSKDFGWGRIGEEYLEIYKKTVLINAIR